MEIQITRYRHKRWGVDGQLYIQGHKVCDTVEHPTLHLPPGTYEMTRKTHPFRHGDGPLKATKGEIIVGTCTLPGLVTQSSETHRRLYERLSKAWQRGTTITLTIE